MNESGLEPHEQLSEIDRHTNDDGTVEVKLLEWEKVEKLDRVTVKYQTPIGEAKTETMDWPESNDSSYKFIRLIEQTPYTLLTAESINDDSDLYVDAHSNPWRLALPEDKGLRDRIPVPERSVPFEALKLLIYPVSLACMVQNLMEKDMEYVGFRGEPYDDTYLEDEKHHHGHVVALKSVLYMCVWLSMFAGLLAIL